jgi:hypothetical protein
MTKPLRAKRIADLNDKFRKSLVTGGRTYMTAGVNAKGAEFVSKALAKVIAFEDFNAANDPHHSTTSARSSSTAEALLEDRLLRSCGRVRVRRPDRPEEDAARPHCHARRGVLNSSCLPRVLGRRGAFCALTGPLPGAEVTYWVAQPNRTILEFRS